MIKYARSLAKMDKLSIEFGNSELKPMGGRKLMQLFIKAGTTAFSLLVALAFCGVLITQTSAQTDFATKDTRSKLERDYQEELDKWMLRAYEGDRDAQFKVGVLFTNEQFDRPDYEQAVYWYKQAARQGHVLAQYNLGHQLLSGVGVEKNETEAMQWWLKAAKQDHALAQFNIGRAFYLGIGVDEDHTKSKKWFERAAQNGEPKSIEILEQLGWAKKGAYTKQLAKSDPKSSADSTNSQGTSSEVLKESTANANTNPELENQNTKPSVVAETTTKTTPTTTQEPVVDESRVKPEGKAASPLAVYTDPAVRSVLIGIVERREELELVDETDMWSIVTSRVGFPVWVHSDYLNVTDNYGVVSGDSVNARSVPIVTNGTVVGRLQRDEKLALLDQRNEWFRVTAPLRFKAWVKTNDFKAVQASSQETEKATTQNQSPAKELITDKKPLADEKPLADKKPSEDNNRLADKRPLTNQALSANTELSTDNNDNAWLFSQPADSYTLQLASFDEPAKVNEFISTTTFANNSDLHRFTAQGNEIAWTYFLYGNYRDKAQADDAKAAIKQKRAWVRSFGRLQQNRCVAWKKQLPTPKELNTYCVE